MNDSVKLGKWRDHHMGLDSLAVGHEGFFVYCPVCGEKLLIDEEQITCPRCGSIVKINVQCKETLEGQAWIG